MRKIALMFGAALVSASFMVSCCGNTSIELNDRVDSINYAYGSANGDGILQYVIGTDTTPDKLQQFADGFSEAFCELKTEKRLEIEAARFAQTFMNDVKGDVLFADTTIAYCEAIFNENLEKGLRNETAIMTSEEGMAYVQQALFVPLDSGVARSQGQVDSINVAYAVVNAGGIRQYLLGKDTTEANIDAFIAHFEKGKEKGMDSKLYFEGLRIGMTMYGQLEQSKFLMGDSIVPLNTGIIKEAVIRAITGENTLMDAKAATDYFNAYIESKSAKEAEGVSTEGVKFLEENKAKEGVQVTESGLQYVVKVMGEGAMPALESTVKVHYEGRLINGKVFDSSIERGEPISFPLTNVIKGWTEGLQLMPIGSKFTFYIPYELGYGDKGAGQDIPPYATLIFDVELIDIEK